jgi:L-threonylcarbamoyladenylate synthase
VITEVGSDLKKAIDLIKEGQIVAIPTETVYGLAANGLNELAIQKIFEAKERPKSNPLILHFSTPESILPYVLDFPDDLLKLAKVFWPGPLTVLLKKSASVPNIITANQEQVAVRIPSHPIALELLNQLKFPLAAPSANLYGKISPTKSTHVFDQLNGKIPYIIEGGDCSKGLESTIIGMKNEKITVYRLGSISVEAIENILGYQPSIHIYADGAPQTSGMVKHHYAPTTPLYFMDSTKELDTSTSSGFIFFKNDFIHVENKVILSESGDLEEAARKLYDTLHLMDSKAFQRIYVERFPESELGTTINDRLKRASLKF